MPEILDESVKKQLTELFMALAEAVTLIFIGSREDNCEYCESTHQMVEEITALSDRLSLLSYDLDDNPKEADEYNIDKAPAIIVAGKHGDEIIDYGIRFFGIPAGHEFAALIRAILMVSRRDSGLSAETRQYLSELKEPVHLVVFSTPT